MVYDVKGAVLHETVRHTLVRIRDPNPRLRSWLLWPKQQYEEVS